MEISWNKLVILDMCKESQCGWNTVNRVENANMESFNNRGQILQGIVGPRRGVEFDSKFSNGKPLEDFKQRTGTV